MDGRVRPGRATSSFLRSLQQITVAKYKACVEPAEPEQAQAEAEEGEDAEQPFQFGGIVEERFSNAQDHDRQRRYTHHFVFLERPEEQQRNPEQQPHNRISLDFCTGCFRAIDMRALEDMANVQGQERKRQKQNKAISIFTPLWLTCIRKLLCRFPGPKDRQTIGDQQCIEQRQIANLLRCPERIVNDTIEVDDSEHSNTTQDQPAQPEAYMQVMTANP